MNIYLVIDYSTLIIHGCFTTRKKALKYAMKSSKMVIQKLKAI